MHWACNAFMLSTLVSGLLLGSSLPSAVTKLLHPMVTTALVANLGALILGHVTGAGYVGTLQTFLTKVSSGASFSGFSLVPTGLWGPEHMAHPTRASVCSAPEQKPCWRPVAGPRDRGRLP